MISCDNEITYKVLKENNLALEILYPAKVLVSFNTEC